MMTYGTAYSKEMKGAKEDWLKSHDIKINTEAEVNHTIVYSTTNATARRYQKRNHFHIIQEEDRKWLELLQHTWKAVGEPPNSPCHLHIVACSLFQKEDI